MNKIAHNIFRFEDMNKLLIRFLNNEISEERTLPICMMDDIKEIPQTIIGRIKNEIS